MDCAVIGAGVVGLAVARRLALDGRRVVVFEAESAIGAHASSHNSGVIHAGVYYPTGSLKARLCVAGRHALYEYAERRGVPHRRVGKLMVAVEECELPAMERIARLGAANGVSDLVMLGREDVRAMEPALNAAAAIFSPSTGIVDTAALMTALREDLEDAGGRVECDRAVLGVERAGDGFELRTESGSTRVRAVVNAAGHHAPRVAQTITGVPKACIPQAHFARGHYFTLPGLSLVQRLVYPMPSVSAPHVHLSLTLDGRARFGPDVHWSDTPHYDFHAARGDFAQAVRRYLPALGMLEPDGVGIRAKIVAKGEPAADFVIQGPESHGATGLVNLFGVESPGLTSCLAIADAVADLAIFD